MNSGSESSGEAGPAERGASVAENPRRTCVISLNTRNFVAYAFMFLDRRHAGSKLERPGEIAQRTDNSRVENYSTNLPAVNFQQRTIDKTLLVNIQYVIS